MSISTTTSRPSKAFSRAAWFWAAAGTATPSRADTVRNIERVRFVRTATGSEGTRLKQDKRRPRDPANTPELDHTSIGSPGFPLNSPRGYTRIRAGGRRCVARYVETAAARPDAPQSGP